MFTYSSRSIKISADIDCVLGCGTGEVVSCHETDDLEANICFLSDSRGNKILFISIDALYVGSLLTRRITAGLSGVLSRNEIFIGATHCHNAPMLDDTKPLLGDPDLSHVEQIAQKITDAANDVISQKGTEINALFRQYEVNSVVHRRKIVPVNITRAGISFFRTLQIPNFDKEQKVTSEVLEFVDENHNLLGTLWVMPCHPTSYPDPNEVSSHYIGVIRQKIREKTGQQQLPLMFFQGASGDLRPPALSKATPGLRGLFKSLLQPQGFSNFTREDYNSWCEQVWDEFQNTTEHSMHFKNSDEQHSISSKITSMDLDQIYEYSYPEVRKVEFQFVKIDSFQIFGLTAEPTWEVRQSILPHANLGTVVGCMADTFGYLVTNRQFKEGGYESTGFLAAFGIKHNQNMSPINILTKLIRS